MRKNVLEYLESSARMHADKPAFCDENRVFTFGELLKAAQGLGTYLAAVSYTHLDVYKRQLLLRFVQKNPQQLMCVCGTPVGHGDFEMYPAAVPYLIGHLQRTMRRNLPLYIAVIQQLCKFVMILRVDQFAAVLTHGRHKRMLIILQHGLKI